MQHSSGALKPRLFVIGSYVEAHCWMVPRLPRSDESHAAQGYVRECAGKGLAVGLGAHRLGATVDLLLAVGHDAAGDSVLQLLSQEGLESSLVYRLGPQSGQGCGLIDAQGEPAIAVYAGANALLGTGELQRSHARLTQASVVYAQLEVPQPTVAHALRTARAAGAITVLNPSPWPQEDDCWEVFDAASVAVLNRREAEALLQVLGVKGELEFLDDVVLRAIWRHWPSGEWLVVTLGSEGCVAYACNGVRLRAPGHEIRVEHAVGAGDAFSAGLCADLALGAPMSRALKSANACGALAASKPGILSALPYRSELSALVGQPDPIGS